MRYLIGIDEAGRGPLAGPVAVGIVAVPFNFDWKLIPGVGDSKMVLPKNREAIFRRVYAMRKQGMIIWRVAMVGASVIDKKGISHAVKLAVNRGLKTLDCRPDQCEIKLDGLLKAPAVYRHQETITKGDSKEKVIGLASILAKVTRDRYMRKISAEPKFSAYDFALHKGYGTEKHRKIIAKIGLSSIHRRSFCGNLLG